MTSIGLIGTRATSRNSQHQLCLLRLRSEYGLHFNTIRQNVNCVYSCYTCERGTASGLKSLPFRVRLLQNISQFSGPWPSRLLSHLLVLRSFSRKTQMCFTNFRSHGLREFSLASWSWNPSLVKLKCVSHISGLRAFEIFLWPHGLGIHLS